MRHFLVSVALLLATSACGQSPEVTRLKSLVGEYDFGLRGVGLYGAYSTRVGVSMRVTSPTPNSVAFKEEFEIPGGFSRTEVAEVELRFDAQTKRYLFDFRTVKRAIKDLVLSYTDNKGWEGSGQMSLPRAGGGDEKAVANVSIDLDTAKGESDWTVTVPNPSAPNNPLEYYHFKFAKRPAPAKK